MTAQKAKFQGVEPSALASMGPRPLESAGAPVLMSIEEPEARGRSRFQYVTSIIALYCTEFIGALNTTIIITAVPTIVHELDSAAGYAWIGAAYTIGVAATGTIWAKLSDIWGRKPILLTAVAAYFCSSIICAVAINMTMLIIARALQGMACGGLATVVSIVICDLFSLRNRGFYLGLLEIVYCIAGAIGPVIGATLAETASWRWIFWINLPVCFVAFTLLFFTLKVHDPQTPLRAGLKAVDWAGSLSMLTVLVLVLLSLNFGGVLYPWSSSVVICLLVFGSAMVVVFIFAEKKLARHPIIPLQLFANRSNVAALAVGFTHDFGLISSRFYLPLFFQSAFGTSAVLSAVLILPLGLSTSIVGILAGIFIHRTGRYTALMHTGMGLMTLGYGVWITWKANTSLPVVIGTQIVVGLGTGMLFAPPMISLQVNVHQDNIATATATLGLVRNVATAVAVVIGQTIFANRMSSKADALFAVGLTEGQVRLFAGADATANLGAIADIRDPLMNLGVRQIFADSMRFVWVVNTAVCGVGLVASFFIVKGYLTEEHVETRTGLKDANGMTSTANTS